MSNSQRSHRRPGLHSVVETVIETGAALGLPCLLLSLGLIGGIAAFGSTARGATPTESALQDSAGLHCPNWKDEVRLYGIAPHYADPRKGQSFKAITTRLPRLAHEGYNMIWLQPIQANHGGGQGYEVTDYFKVWDELGTEADLKNLVAEAHRLGLRVILDFVANHTSIEHPFAQDVVRNGSKSTYFDWYMHEFDQAPYAQHYNKLKKGDVTFVYYFWDHLVNLNVANAKVREHLISATEHWVKDFDVDGFRFDASWGPLARWPKFFPEMKARLQKLKPEVFLLAEDKAVPTEAFKGLNIPNAGEIFDAAYDWTNSKDYVSEWAWQTDSHDKTLFNSVSDEDRLSLLRKAVHPTVRLPSGWGRTLRFLENNDLPRFNWNHTKRDSRLAATLIFTLPGLPLVYYGQEVGIDEHYPTLQAIEEWASQSGKRTAAFYRRLVRIRKTRVELSCGSFKELRVIPKDAATRVFAFERAYLGQRTRILMNLTGEPVKIQVRGLVPAPERRKELKPYEVKLEFEGGQAPENTPSLK